MNKNAPQGDVNIHAPVAGFSLHSSLLSLRMALLAIYIIPLVVITYIFIEYVYPLFVATGKEESALGITAMLTFAVILSVLGLAAISRSVRGSGETLQSLNDRMGRLLASTKQFEEAGYVDTLVDSVAASAKEVLAAEASSLLLYDGSGALRFEYAEGPASRTVKGKTVKPGEGIVGWTAQEGRPVIINDIRSDPRFTALYDQCSGVTAKSVMCVPLCFAGRTLGVLEVINKRNGEGFSEHDQRALVSLAEHASAAIYRNKTIEEMRGDFVHVTDILMIALDNFMPEKKGHSRRVARYSVKLAKGLGLSEEDVRKVYFGALLHDVGLLKFDLAEYEDRSKFRLHPALGADMVKNVAQWKDIAPIIHDHHERYDGAGYPAGLTGPEIALGARIVGLAEAFDIMIRDSYKPKMGFEEAAEEIKALSGYQFDPQVAELFLRSFKEDDVLEA